MYMLVVLLMVKDLLWLICMSYCIVVPLGVTFIFILRCLNKTFKSNTYLLITHLVVDCILMKQNKKLLHKTIIQVS